VPGEANGNVALSRAGSAHQNDVALVVEEGASRKLRDQLAIDYQLGVAKLPLAKELAELSLQGTPINAVDLANKLEIEAKLDRQGRTADGLMRVNLVSSSAASISRISERSLMVAPLACRHASEPSDWDHGLRLWNRDRLRRLCPVMILIERRQCSNRSLWRLQSSHARRAGRVSSHWLRSLEFSVATHCR